MENQRVSVSQLTNSIQYIINEGIGKVSVTGEISNYKPATSGHKYFTLKDDFAQIACVMWRSRRLNFIPRDGMKVVATGTVTVYAPRGQYQLDCISLEPLGTGDLYAAFEALKAKLEAKGYFDRAQKKQIPQLSLKIGVITSPTGAAVRDIFSTLKRRLPLAEVVFRPALVQGDEAAADIAKAIAETDSAHCDVIICGRGGGSIEDLWCFNTEIVADAIHKCKTPIVSAVGHETDFTIADFAADVRAATPTAAAELVSSLTKETMLGIISDGCRKLQNSALNKIKIYRNQLSVYNRENMRNRMLNNINSKRQRLDDLHSMMQKSVVNRIEKESAKVESLKLQLAKLNPSKPLERGYAIIKTNGKFLNPKQKLMLGEVIEIERIAEISEAEVKAIKNV